MPKIAVKFQAESKVSKAGRDYQLVEMWIAERDGSWPERPTVSLMPFHARLLLQHLPEFCEAIKGADNLKEGGLQSDPQDEPLESSPF